jgi:mannose-1-phosphate guanylyltransferase
VQQAVDAAVTNPDALLTFGVRPTWPHTGLGYIHHAKQSIEEGLYEVEGFTEKPDHHTARRFVDSGQYCWNSGMFVWTVPAIRNALTKYLPDSAKKLAPVAEAVREGKDPSGIIDKVYPQLEKISIDYAVMEKAEKVLMVELKCEWLDVGSWPAMENVTDLDEGGNAVLADNAIMIDSFRNIVVSEDEHLLAVLGIDDCVVVHAKDATLVCTKSDAQRLKELVNHLGEKYGGKYV